MVYSFKKKRYCVRQLLLGLTSASDISRNRKVPRRKLYRWLEAYKKGGWDALKEHNAGAPALEINPDFEKVVIEFWHQHKYGAEKTHFKLKERGYTVSQRQIQKVFNKHCFQD